MPTERFTVDGSAALEAHLADTCRKVVEGVRGLVPGPRLAGILLGGGYGRGEGGVLREARGDQPYNDLEFYVFVHGSAFLAERRLRDPLHHLGESLSPAAGLEVEFKALSPGKLRHAPPSMFYYDLVMGHRRVAGDPGLLAGCDHHRDQSRIPLHEATRLLMNRCSGLLFSAERLARPEFGPDEADFVGRNLAKARLAFGDVLLTALGKYHWSCRERHRLLLDPALAAEASLPLDDLRRLHADGVAFKFHPVRSNQSRDDLARAHRELSELGRPLWLWLESRRLGVDFSSTRDYAFSSIDKCPETTGLRNRLINVRHSGLRSALDPRGARYPRERLLQSLALLLWEPGALANPETRERIRTDLRTTAGDLPGVAVAYAALWSRYN